MASGPTPPFNMRLPLDIREELELAAAKNDRSLTKEIVSRLQRSLRTEREVERLYGSKENHRLANILSIAVERAGAKFGGRNWLHDAEVFDFTMELIIRTLGAMHPDGSYTGVSDYQVYGDAKKEARLLWRDIVTADERDRLNPYLNIASDLGPLLKRPNVYRDEYKARHGERLGALMKKAGIPLSSLDWNGLGEAKRAQYLQQRGELWLQAEREVEAEMIAQGRDPQLSREDNF